MAQGLTLKSTIVGGGKECIGVIGAGIIGLQTAVRAQEAGHPVTLYYAKSPLETTSAIAGASFMPHAVAENRLTDEMIGYGWGYYEKAANDHFDSGVRLHRRWEASSMPKAPTRFHNVVLPAFDLVEGSNNIPGGYPYAIRYETFIVDTPTHLSWLQGQFLDNGGKMIQRRFIDIQEITELHEKVIFNATGLGAKDLFHDDKLRPVKGQLAVVQGINSMNDSVSADGFYVYPHLNRTIIGGTAEWDNDTTHVDPGAEQLILRGNYRVLAEHIDPVSLQIRARHAGLRPYRDDSVRIEAEELGDTLVVHNYGHGGSGITYAPGSALLALNEAALLT